MKRITIPGLPHHVVQRGLQGRQTFLSHDDYAVYLEIITECCLRHGVDVWAYCLMPDHVHLIACTRYIEINPVKRDYVDEPEDWLWSSAKAHIMKSDDPLVQTGPLLERVETEWRDFLAETRPAAEADLFYSHEKTGLPLGSDEFLAMVGERQ